MKYRVKAYSRLESHYGYVGRYWVRYQALQRKRWWGWETIDTERVPEWVDAYNAVGGCDWRSKFANFGSWGRDGAVTPHG